MQVAASTYGAREFARIVVARRRELGWSMRTLARAAGVSQPHLVGLERPVREPRRRAPVPSIDVFTRVVGALGLDPVETYAAVSGAHGAHVLVVTDGVDGTRAVERLRRRWRDEVDDWVWCGEDRRVRSSGMRRMSLHTHREPSYVPERVEAALRQRLRRARPSVRGRRLGMVFAESGAMMTRFGDATTVLDFEDRWSRVAAQACGLVGARAVVNACGYDVAHLRATDDPVGVVERLVEAHTDVWYADRRGLRTGARAVADLRASVTPRRIPRG